jgi:hypothetical protein
MKKHQLAVVSMMLLAANACRSGLEQTESSDTVSLRAAYHDQQCHSDVAGIKLIQNEISLANWWQPLANRQFPVKPLPQELGAIDFDKTTLIIVLMGSRPTAGYGIELYDDQAPVQVTALTIPATWKEPARDAMVAQIMTSPCVVISVPAKHYESVAVRDQQGNTLVETRIPPE